MELLFSFAKNIGNMFQAKGEIKFEYLGTVKKVKYIFWNLAGTPVFVFDDKLGRSHQFQKVFGKWEARCNVQPDWRPDFIEVLCESFELEFQVIYARHRNVLYGINGANNR